MRTIFVELHGVGYPEDADVTQAGNERFSDATKIDAHRVALVKELRARIAALISCDTYLRQLLHEHRIDRITFADAHAPGESKRDGATALELGDWPW